MDSFYKILQTALLICVVIVTTFLTARAENAWAGWRRVDPTIRSMERDASMVCKMGGHPGCQHLQICMQGFYFTESIEGPIAFLKAERGLTESQQVLFSDALRGIARVTAEMSAAARHSHHSAKGKEQRHGGARTL